MNILALVLFFLALIVFILGVFSAAITHPELWGLAFLTAGFIVERLAGYVTPINRP